MRECWTVWVARCCLCDSFQMFAEKDKREEKLEDWIWYNMCVFLSSRLPEPRAEPMNPRDFEDNDSGPSMDHAPWYKKIRLLLRPPVLHCLLQPAVSSLELSGWPSLCQPSPWDLALPFQCLLAVKWPWRKLLWQIWIATSFLLKLF